MEETLLFSELVDEHIFLQVSKNRLVWYTLAHNQIVLQRGRSFDIDVEKFCLSLEVVGRVENATKVPLCPSEVDRQK
jgi:hypothetical protein